MAFKTLLRKVKRRLVQSGLLPFVQWLRIHKYKLFSTCIKVTGRPVRYQPLLMKGDGSIVFKDNVRIGVLSSPYFFSTYSYIEVRKPQSEIIFGNNVWINNNACFLSEGEGIKIGDGTLIGTNFCAFDSDFHELAIDKRMSGIPRTAAIVIGKNVFIGSNVTVLKGVSIGENAVIANSSVVTKNIPANVIAGGNPCKVIRQLNE